MQKITIVIIFITFIYVVFSAYAKGTFPVPVLETFIESEIKPGDVLKTNSVSFKFTGKNLRNSKDRPSVDVFLYPIEKKWNRFNSGARTFSNLKSGNYIVVARANIKYGNRVIYDRTPTFVYFKINVSDYYKKISLSYTNSGKQISLYNSSKEPVNITRWKIKSLLGEWEIPQAVKFVNPSFTQDKSDIILQSGEKIIIKSGRSPIGFDFKPNKCFSFLPKSYRPDFSYSGYCSQFSRDELFELKREKFLSDKCIDVIKANLCKTPIEKDLKKIFDDYTCNQFISDNLNYQGCYKNHKNSGDFLTKDWRVYINVLRFGYTRYDNIRIFDRNGLLVVEKKIY